MIIIIYLLNRTIAIYIFGITFTSFFVYYYFDFISFFDLSTLYKISLCNKITYRKCYDGTTVHHFDSFVVVTKVEGRGLLAIRSEIAK